MPTQNESCCLRSFPTAATIEEALNALEEIKEQLGNVVVLVQPESRGIKPVKVRPDGCCTAKKIGALFKDPYAGKLTFIPRFAKTVSDASPEAILAEVRLWGMPCTVVVSKAGEEERQPPCTVYFTERTDHHACAEMVMRECSSIRKVKGEPLVSIRDFC